MVYVQDRISISLVYSDQIFGPITSHWTIYCINTIVYNSYHVVSYTENKFLKP